MFCRKLSIGLSLLAVALLVTAARADDTPKPKHEGWHRATFVSTASGKLVVNNKKDGEKTLDLSDKVAVTIDGNPGKIEDLQKGDKVGYKLGDDGKVVAIHKGKAGAPAPAPSTPAPAPTKPDSK